MFENMYLLSLPAINLHNINLLYPETYYERAVKSPFRVCCKERAEEEGCLKELLEERLDRMKEMVRGR